MTTKIENDNFSLNDNNKKFSLINNGEKVLIKTDYPVKFSNFIFDKNNTTLTDGNLYLDNENASEEIIHMNNTYNNMISKYRNATAFYINLEFKATATNIFVGKGAVQYAAVLNVHIPEINGAYPRTYINLYLFGSNNKLLFEKKINGDAREQEDINRTIVYKYENYVKSKYDYDFKKKQYEYTLRIESSGRNNENDVKILKIKNPILNNESYAESVEAKIIIAFAYTKN